MALKKQTNEKQKFAKAHPMHRIPKIGNCVLLMLNAKIHVGTQNGSLQITAAASSRTPAMGSVYLPIITLEKNKLDVMVRADDHTMQILGI